MTPETIGISISYDKPVKFSLRMVGLEEEAALRQKTFGLTDAEKAEKQYQANVDLLADLAQNTEGIPYSPDKSIAENVREYFAEKNVTKERLAEYAVRAYFVRLQPEVSFF